MNKTNLCLNLLLDCDEELDMSMMKEEQQIDDDENVLFSLLLQCVVDEEEKTLWKFGSTIETIITQFTDKQFENNFGIERNVATWLSDRFSKTLHYRSFSQNNAISPRNHMHVFLWYIRHQYASYRHVSRFFHTSVSTVHGVLQRVSKFLATMNDGICWPEANQRRKTAHDYLQRTGVPGIIGCIGQMYIVTEQASIITVHAICNERNQFTYVHCTVGDEGIPLPHFHSDEYIITELDCYCRIHNNIIASSDEQLTHVIAKQLAQCFRTVVTTFKQLNCLKIPNQTTQFDLIRSCFLLHNLNVNNKQQQTTLQK